MTRALSSVSHLALSTEAKLPPAPRFHIDPSTPISPVVWGDIITLPLETVFLGVDFA